MGIALRKDEKQEFSTGGVGVAGEDTGGDERGGVRGDGEGCASFEDE